MTPRFATLLLAFALPLAAQWNDYRDPQTPRKDGKPNLTAPAPRQNGKPDLSGVWRAERASESELNNVMGPDFTKVEIDINDVAKHYINIFWGMKRDQEPLRPEALAVLKTRAKLAGPTD